MSVQALGELRGDRDRVPGHRRVGVVGEPLRGGMGWQREKLPRTNKFAT